MIDRLLNKAKTAKRESKTIEFKQSFDIESSRDWLEIVKDIVALANTGGGAIVFGVRNNGTPSDFDATSLLGVDPAEITDKIAKFSGEQFASFTIEEVSRNGRKMAAFLIGSVPIPVVFNREGNYEGEGGQQKFAFRKGTVYFRHGAKSEPATTNDLRETVERELERIRSSWIGDIRKVVEAPKGSQIQVVSPTSLTGAARVRVTEDREAMPVQRLSPDQTHPYRQKETLEQVNKRLGGTRKVNSFDILCVRKVHGIDTNHQYFYGPMYASPQYSDAFVDWLVSQQEKDSAFFDSCRAKFRGMRRKTP